MTTYWWVLILPAAVFAWLWLRAKRREWVVRQRLTELCRLSMEAERTAWVRHRELEDRIKSEADRR
jgi:hypothetical protein